MPGIHGGFVVRVAIQTGKHTIVRCIRMAIGAGVPLTLVAAAVNGKILPVMIKTGTLPRSDAVATFAVMGEP